MPPPTPASELDVEDAVGGPRLPRLNRAAIRDSKLVARSLAVVVDMASELVVGSSEEEAA